MAIYIRFFKGKLITWIIRNSYGELWAHFLCDKYKGKNSFLTLNWKKTFLTEKVLILHGMVYGHQNNHRLQPKVLSSLWRSYVKSQFSLAPSWLSDITTPKFCVMNQTILIKAMNFINFKFSFEAFWRS